MYYYKNWISVDKILVHVQIKNNLPSRCILIASKENFKEKKREISADVRLKGDYVLYTLNGINSPYVYKRQRSWARHHVLKSRWNSHPPKRKKSQIFWTFIRKGDRILQCSLSYYFYTSTLFFIHYILLLKRHKEGQQSLLHPQILQHKFPQNKNIFLPTKTSPAHLRNQD